MKPGQPTPAVGPRSRHAVLQIGRDPRLSGPELLQALAAGINSRGAGAADFGLATTPAMFMSCILPGARHPEGLGSFLGAAVQVARLRASTMSEDSSLSKHMAGQPYAVRADCACVQATSMTGAA